MDRVSNKDLNAVNFVYNHEIGCRKSRLLQADKIHLVLYVGKTTAPFILKESEDDEKLGSKALVTHWLDVSLTEHHMMWGARAIRAVDREKGFLLAYLPEFAELKQNRELKK